MSRILLVALRLWIIIAVWAFVWKVVEPRTQKLRILRAALLLVCLLVVLAVLRIAG
ncbi:MAG: hypothetical protein JSV99_02225 [Planctomycetota bacterium]|nr:MAG: hypothetical protein JSV99_02225 [Planctomycetota bacterium]